MKYDENHAMKDFLDRTFKIIDQYDKIKDQLGNESYEVTLLINSLFGIVIMPKTHWHSKLQNTVFTTENGDIIVSIDGKTGSLKGYNVGFIMNSLRNSLAHWGDTRGGRNNGEQNILFLLKEEKISGIIFENKQQQFKLTFQTIDSLKSFLNEFKRILTNKTREI